MLANFVSAVPRVVWLNLSNVKEVKIYTRNLVSCFILLFIEVRSNLEVDRLVPVELNSVLQRCSSILSHWYDQSGKPELRDQYLKISNDIQYGIDEVSTLFCLIF